MVVIPEQERQVEDLGLRDPAAEDGDRVGGRLQRSEPEPLGHLDLAAELPAREELDVDLAAAPLFHELGPASNGDHDGMAVAGDRGPDLDHDRCLRGRGAGEKRQRRGNQEKLSHLFHPPTTA
jgi:hypothetical protein